MIIALFTNPEKNHRKPIIAEIRDFLIARGVRLVAEDSAAPSFGVESLSKIDPKSVDFIISLGGDGTILRIFHEHPELDAPLLGINLGSLGFMADITLEEVYPSLESLLNGNHQIQNRLMIHGEASNQQSSFAINDIVIHRAKNPFLIELAIYVDGNYLNTFSADGIIVATPNGSTAYSLSAGGPILTPELDALILTPICPHTISNRPIVLMPKKEIELRYLNEADPIEITYDGHTRVVMHSGERFRIMRSPRTFRLVTMLHYDYFSTLRTKLGWTGKLKKIKEF